MSESETINISVADKVYTVPRRHALHYQEAIQQRCIALMDEAEAGEDIAAPTGFAIGDVVSLKSGGPRMTVEGISEEDGVVTVHCSWFALLSRDPAFPAWDQDGVRYAATASRGVFGADCLEY